MTAPTVYANGRRTRSWQQLPPPASDGSAAGRTRVLHVGLDPTRGSCRTRARGAGVPGRPVIADTLSSPSRIAEHSLPSLMATKRLIIEADHENIGRARELEGQAFAELLRLPNVRDRVVAQLDKQPG